MRHRLLFILFLAGLASPAAAQVTVPELAPFDTAYIADHVHDLVLRVYGSNKFTRYAVGKYGQDRWAQYKPNSNYNAGFGFNYRFLGINIGFKTPGINNDDDKYGRTKYLDLQSYVYMRKLCLDLYAQDYKGYYLADNQLLRPTNTGPAEALRPDIRTRDLGLDAEYLFNGRRFSYRAVYLQNERQLKSAGTLIAGAGFRYVYTNGDSALLPSGPAYAALANGLPFNRSAAASVTVKGGYAYTLVVAGRFFLTGSLVAGAGVNYVRLKAFATGEERNGAGPELNAIARFGVGYNSDRYFAGLYFTTNLLHEALPGPSGSWQQYETGLLRLAIARRLVLPKQTADRIDRLLPGKRG